MASRSLAQQIVVASEVTTQILSAKFETISACDMARRGPVHDLESSTCVSCNLETKENFAMLAVTEIFSTLHVK